MHKSYRYYDKIHFHYSFIIGNERANRVSLLLSYRSQIFILNGNLVWQLECSQVDELRWIQ